jgi:hypothetical protein
VRAIRGRTLSPTAIRSRSLARHGSASLRPRSTQRAGHLVRAGCRERSPAMSPANPSRLRRARPRLKLESLAPVAGLPRQAHGGAEAPRWWCPSLADGFSLAPTTRGEPYRTRRAKTRPRDSSGTVDGRRRQVRGPTEDRPPRHRGRSVTGRRRGREAGCTPVPERASLSHQRGTIRTDAGASADRRSRGERPGLRPRGHAAGVGASRPLPARLPRRSAAPRSLKFRRAFGCDPRGCSFGPYPRS